MMTLVRLLAPLVASVGCSPCCARATVPCGAATEVGCDGAWARADVAGLVRRDVRLRVSVGEHRVGRVAVDDLGGRQRRSGRALERNVGGWDREQRRLLRTRRIPVDEAGVDAALQRNAPTEPE